MNETRHAGHRFRPGVLAGGLLLALLAGSADMSLRAQAATISPGDGGPATAANLNGPVGVVADHQGNLYIADTVNNTVRFVCRDANGCPLPSTLGGSLAKGDITTIAGNGSPCAGTISSSGSATAACMYQPLNLTIDKHGDVFFTQSNVVSFVCLEVNAACHLPAGAGGPLVQPGDITTVAGSGQTYTAYGGDGGPADHALFSAPFGLALDPSGNVWVAESNFATVRYVCLQSASCVVYPSSSSPIIVPNGDIQTVVGAPPTTAGYCPTTPNNGNGPPFPAYGSAAPALEACMAAPTGLAFDGSATNLFILDAYEGVFQLNVTAGVVGFVAKAGNYPPIPPAVPITAAFSGLAWTASGGPDGSLLIANYNFCNLLTVRVPTGSGAPTYTLLAGNWTQCGYSGDNGPATSAVLNSPEDAAYDKYGDIFIADTYNNRIREIVAGTGVIMTVAGNGIP